MPRIRERFPEQCSETAAFAKQKILAARPRSLSTRNNHYFTWYFSSVRVGVHILVQRIVGYPGLLAAQWLRPLLKQGVKVPEGDCCGGAPSQRTSYS